MKQINRKGIWKARKQLETRLWKMDLSYNDHLTLIQSYISFYGGDTYLLNHHDRFMKKYKEHEKLNNEIDRFLK